LKNETSNKRTLFRLSKQELKEYGYVRSLKINWGKYKKANDLSGDVEPVVHCVKNGKYTNIIIPGYFETAEYMALNPDVIKFDVHPLVHYEESRIQGVHVNKPKFFNLNRQRKSAQKQNLDGVEQIVLSRLELDDFFSLYTTSIPWIKFQAEKAEGDEIDLMVYAIKNWQTSRIIIKGVYDSKVYLDSNEDVNVACINPLVHFFKYGRIEKRTAKDNSENRKFEIDIIKSKGVDWEGFFDFNAISNSRQNDPVEYYVDNWMHENLRLKDFFDTAFYLKNYEDIADINMNPLFHYVTNGQQEGRKGFLDIDAYIQTGGHKFDENLPTIAIVSHESSATGAPLVGLNLGNSIASQHNVIHFLVKKKHIHNDFVTGSCMTVTNLADNPRFFLKALIEAIVEKYPLIGAVCNSVETIEILDVMSELNIPTVSLIHEFSDYTLPKGKISNAICFADRAIVPANIIKNSIITEFKGCFGIDVDPNNISVYPQGHLPFVPTLYGDNLSADELKIKFSLLEGQVLIVGAGYVQIRKGVDLFISVANYLNKNQPGKYKFVWAGDGYDPDHDLTYSVWLKKQIIESNLEDDFIFLGHQRSLSNLLSITDVFLLTSRLDPFPNVVIDALASGIHVACFENSTGCAEFLQNNHSCSSIARFADTHHMADKIDQYILSSDEIKSQTQAINKTLVVKELNFENYTNYILQEIELARNIVKQRKAEEQLIDEAGKFEFSFYSILDNHAASLAHYVKCALKGIHISNPSPAFHDIVWLNEHPEDMYSVPLSKAIQSGHSNTHKNTMLNKEPTELVHVKGAIHLHLFYVDMAAFFIEKFTSIPKEFDLYITVCSQDEVKSVRNMFLICGFNFVEVICVENEGRDIVPLFSALKSHLYDSKKYDILGHFHSKKSLDNDTGFGDKWLNYLADNLLGDEKYINQILELLSNDNIGLVFAADHHIVGFGENKAYSDSICDSMGIAKLNNAANFPIGTMFWSKPAALSHFFELDLKPFTQKEPLGYDGSYMHAIERLLPHVVQVSGYEVSTVHAPGTSW
jgi:glycosyltransferase involved in cell wall biosynthesis